MASFTARTSHVLPSKVNRWPVAYTASNLAMNRASRTVMSPDSPSTSCAARTGRYATPTRRVAGEPGSSPPYGSRPGEGPRVGVGDEPVEPRRVPSRHRRCPRQSQLERAASRLERASRRPRAALDVRGPERVESEREALDVELAPELVSCDPRDRLDGAEDVLSPGLAQECPVRPPQERDRDATAREDVFWPPTATRVAMLRGWDALRPNRPLASL